MPPMSYSSEMEAAEPWRKHGFIVKPYYGNDRDDAKRWFKELPRALDDIVLSDDWTARDVLDGRHEGGDNNPIAAGSRGAESGK